MKKLTLSVFAMLLLASFADSSARADEIDVISSFYGRLADIIEQYRNEPDMCATKAEEFIRKNAASVNDAAASARAKGEQQQPSEEEVNRMARQPPMQMSTSRLGDSMQRFQLVFSVFAQKHPEQASRITRAVSEYQTAEQSTTPEMPK